MQEKLATQRYLRLAQCHFLHEQMIVHLTGGYHDLQRRVPGPWMLKGGDEASQDTAQQQVPVKGQSSVTTSIQQAWCQHAGYLNCMHVYLLLNIFTYQAIPTVVQLYCMHVDTTHSVTCTACQSLLFVHPAAANNTVKRICNLCSHG